MLGKLNVKLAAVVLSVTTLASPAYAEMTLRYADHGANRGGRAASAVWMLSEIAARTDGRIVIEEHWAGALLGAKTMLEGLSSDVASIGTLIGSYYPKEFVGWRVGDLPVPNPHEVAGAMAMHEMLQTNPDLIAEFDRQDLKYLASYSVGPAQMICNTGPITKLEDFDGLKVRYAGEYGKILAQYGAIPVALSVTKAYQALDTGLIDCSQVYGYLTLAFKMYEVANYYVVFDEGTLQSNAIVMNKEVFESLDPVDQQILIEIGNEMTKSNAETIRKANQGAIAKLEAGIDGHVVNVSYLSDEAKAQLTKSSAGAIAAWIEDANKNGFDGQALVDEFQGLVARNLEIYKD